MCTTSHIYGDIGNKYTVNQNEEDEETTCPSLVVEVSFSSAKLMEEPPEPTILSVLCYI